MRAHIGAVVTCSRFAQEITRNPLVYPVQLRLNETARRGFLHAQPPGILACLNCPQTLERSVHSQGYIFVLFLSPFALGVANSWRGRAQNVQHFANPQNADR